MDRDPSFSYIPLKNAEQITGEESIALFTQIEQYLKSKVILEEESGIEAEVLNVDSIVKE